MLKITNQDLNNQMKKMRKENLKLKRLDVLKHCLSRRKNCSDDDSADSLSFSLEK